MSRVGKLATGVAIFVGGYLVGVYELKYKVYKAIAEVITEKESQ